MSNREYRDRKLLQHQKQIWRKAFEESMKHTSIEGAERNAWKAVDACERAGAFNESKPPIGIDQTDSSVPFLDEYKEAWKRLANRFGDLNENLQGWEQKLVKSMNYFALGRIGINDFQEDLDEIFPESDD